MKKLDDKEGGNFIATNGQVEGVISLDADYVPITKREDRWNLARVFIVQFPVVGCHGAASVRAKVALYQHLTRRGQDKNRLNHGAKSDEKDTKESQKLREAETPTDDRLEKSSFSSTQENSSVVSPELLI